MYFINTITTLGDGEHTGWGVYFDTAGKKTEGGFVAADFVYNHYARHMGMATARQRAAPTTGGRSPVMVLTEQGAVRIAKAALLELDQQKTYQQRCRLIRAGVVLEKE